MTSKSIGDEQRTTIPSHLVERVMAVSAFQRMRVGSHHPRSGAQTKPPRRTGHRPAFADYPSSGFADGPRTGHSSARHQEHSGRQKSSPTMWPPLRPARYVTRTGSTAWLIRSCLAFSRVFSRDSAATLVSRESHQTPSAHLLALGCSPSKRALGSHMSNPPVYSRLYTGGLVSTGEERVPAP